MADSVCGSLLMAANGSNEPGSKNPQSLASVADSPLVKPSAQSLDIEKLGRKVTFAFDPHGD